MLSEEETSFNQLNRDANYVHENFNLVDSYFHVRTLCHGLVDTGSPNLKCIGYFDMRSH